MNQLSKTTAAVVFLSSPSPLGHIVVATHRGKLVGVTFGHRTAGAAMSWLKRRVEQPVDLSDEQPADRELAADVLARLLRYADGEAVDFSDVPVAVDHLTPFGRRVIRACRAIGWGGVRTYGALAATAGADGAARAVGQVMAGNRTPLVVPCHRVVASGGGLGGFSAPEGLVMKRRLLDLESDEAGVEKPRRTSGLRLGSRKTQRSLLAKTASGT